MKKRVSLSPLQLLASCFLLLSACLLLCLACSRRQKAPSFQEFSQELFEREMTSNALNLHYHLAHPENYGIETYPVILPCYVPGSERTGGEEAAAILKALEAFSPRELSDADQYARNLLERELRLSIRLAEYPYYGDPLSPARGMQGELPILLSEYAFRSKKDVEEYLSLLEQAGPYLLSLLTYEQEKALAGLSPSAPSLRKAAQQCDSIVTYEALLQGNHFLQTGFRERLEALRQTVPMSDEEFTDNLIQNDVLLERSLLPAYQNLQRGLLELAETAVASPRGLAALPDGAAYYQALLADVTGSDKTPEEIRALLEQTLVEESEAIRQLAKDYPGCLSSLKDLSHHALGLYDASVILSDLQKRMASSFPALTQACTVTVKTVSPNLRPYSAPAFYLTAPLDAAQQNVIYVNPGSGPSELELYATLAHEGYPGHLYQNAYSAGHLLSPEENPLRRILGCGGYLEGWAIYAETCAYDYASKLLMEQGRTADAVCVQLEKHNRSLQLCLCSLMDLMIHYENATPEDVWELCRAFGIKEKDSLYAVYEAICESPCNYPKYYLGYLEILELQKMSKTLWGESWKDDAFHDFLLRWGPADFENLKKLLQKLPFPSGPQS